MNLIRKGHGQSHRGIIGVESAIVMIAFVIVAAALAFVVLNMGFSTTQKAKTTIIAGLGEASSAMEVSGKVTAIGDTTLSNIRVVAIPIKIVSGGDTVNLQNTTTAMKYLSNSKEYDDIYVAAITSAAFVNVTTAFAAANSQLSAFDNGNPVLSAAAAPDNTGAIVYWTVRANSNAIVEDGEHAIIAIAFRATEKPMALEKFRLEVITPSGSPLTVERSIPSITSTVLDLG